MVREDTGAPSEGTTCAWMVVDEAVGYTHAFYTMWQSSGRLNGTSLSIALLWGKDKNLAEKSNEALLDNRPQMECRSLGSGMVSMYFLIFSV
ncbi:hypothetical protein TNCV_4398351 [Trichonephila clavipes]|nr:hypothetical protein TNCV_4398351 [Trichonephila clavipes]